MKIKGLFWILGALIVSILAFSAVKPLNERLQEALQIFRNHFPQEKIYLQLDKDYYASGRTIWFKAYITHERQPTGLSTILYVELLNKRGEVLQRNKLPIIEGGAHGNFSLSPDLPAGDYRLRAYTLWMLNFDPDYLYERDLHIFEPGGSTTTGESTTPPPDSAFAVQFFPEGGDLIDSIENMVAFKAIDQNGYPIKVKGKIVDNEGNTIDSIHSVHDGMGSFTFTPATGRNYQAIMISDEGSKKTFDLPAAKPYGIALHIIRTSNGKVFFQVKRHERPHDTLNKLYLAAQVQGYLTYFTPIDFSQGYTGGLIPVQKDPAGIMQVTLFTPGGLPLAERLTFIKNNKVRLPLTLQKDSISLQPRGKNVFTFSVPDSVTGNFSVAVTDADQVKQLPSQDNIVSHLLLTADIKGFVYNPAWYFSTDDSATRHGLELVMLTNGWRRFSWQKILHQQYPELKYPAEVKGLQIKGQAFEDGHALKNGKISMFLRSPIDSVTYFISGATEPNGYFEVNHLNFHDTANLYYKGVDTLHKGRTVDVKFASSPAQQDYVLLHEPIREARIPSTPSLKNYLELAAQRNQKDQYISNRTILLQEVNVTATRIPKEQTVEERYTSGMFSSDNGYSFDLTDKTLPYTSIFQYLQGRVPGLLIGGNPINPRVSYRGGRPGFFLDEVPVSASEIANVPVSDIALVKVFRPPFYGGFGGADGAIAIYTRRGGDRNFEPGRGFEKKRVAGYTLVRQFYSPDYAVDKRVNELPDKRATLYWDPTMRMDSTTHSITFSFYNTDITKRFRVVLEGLSRNGKIAHVEKIIE